jgi:ribosomal protein S18 acetylase RimI-like enzyme
VIRLARPDDVDTLLELWRAAGAVPSVTDTPESVTAALARDGSAVLVVEEEGRLVASLIAGWDGWRGNMYRLAVLPGRRRAGIATALVREAERRLVAAGARRLAAIVLEDEAHAVAFWEHAGYRHQPGAGRYAKSLPGQVDAGGEMTRE